MELLGLFIAGCLATWVFLDGLSRKTNAFLWALGTFFLAIIVMPIYFAKRPLKIGEIREGGTAWNVFKNFALFWTIVMVFVGISCLLNINAIDTHFKSTAEQAGYAIGITLVLGIIAMIWFVPCVAVLVVGLLLKQSSIVEKGPTGPLAALIQTNKEI